MLFFLCLTSCMNFRWYQVQRNAKLSYQVESDQVEKEEVQKQDEREMGRGRYKMRKEGRKSKQRGGKGKKEREK